MHYAAIHDQAAVIEQFYKYSNINAVNKKNETPLHCAVNLGKDGSIRALLKAKARTDLKNASNQNVLHLAARSPNTSPEIARELVAYTIQAHSWNTVNDVDGNKNNALHVAAKYANPDVIWEFRRVSFKMQNKKGCTPFHRAVRKGEPDILETMLDIFENMQRAGNINEQNLKGETVLHLAVLAGFHNTVKRLIYLRGDLEVKDRNGDTPLHRLVKLIVKSPNPEDQRRCLDTLDSIIYECPRWFCYSSTFKDLGYSFHSEDVKLIQRYRRQGLTWLIHKITNNDNLSVFTLCFSVGAHEILNKVLTLNTVKYFTHEGCHYNDISDITPLTNGSLAQKYFSIGTNKVTPNICGLELLASVNDTTRAAKVLDIIPIRYLEKIYGRLNLIIFAFLIAIHLIYMFIFSFAGIEISKSFRNTTYTFSPSGLMTVAVYVVVPVEPLVLIIFCIVSFLSAICRRDYKRPVSSMLPYLFYLSYSFLVVSWLVLVSINDRFQDYVLALCLCFGWLYTIVLTRGLKGIHYFWRMIKYMVLKDTLRFLVVYLCVLLAFSFSLHVVFQISSSISDTYPNVGETIFLTFTIMLGMGELFDDNFSQGMSDAGRDTTFAKVLFVVYVILAAIILLNMLIAMMNDSYRTVSEDQKISWRIDSIQLGVRTERLLPLTRYLFRSLGVDLMEIPGEEKGLKVKEKVVLKYFLKLRRGTATKLFSTSHEAADHKEKELNMIKEQITNLNIKMKSVETDMSENSKKLDKLVAHMNWKIVKRGSREK
ncbi:hypothetical protein FSP39_003836 [Pinctada imbricata]|uniref:Ion transport domain-containing protein n=1 Tax=Pinctada imbricata TaxID=66713 RepID=A0AA88YUC3_PINIB|nr:hypothetical protein FSP39_003836 [Pinctada imbricata]